MSVLETLGSLVTPEHIHGIIGWQRQDVGNMDVRKPSSALKLLEEVLELCYATGASNQEVNEVVKKESEKAIRRGEASGNYNKTGVEMEVGDVLSCMIAFVHYANVNPHRCMNETIIRIGSREWTPNVDGILVRPRPPEVY